MMNKAELPLRDLSPIDTLRQHTIAWAMNQAFDDVTAYNEAVGIWHKANSNGVSPERVLKTLTKAAVRTVIERARMKDETGIHYTGWLRYIDTHSQFMPHGIHRDGGFDYQPYGPIAPEIRVVCTLDDLVQPHGNAPVEGYTKRDREAAMATAGEQAGDEYDRTKQRYEQIFEGRLAWCNQYPARDQLTLLSLEA